MRKALCTLLAAVVVLGLAAAPAEAAKVTAKYASITSVEPELVTTGSDECGPYCEYRARVTVSWSGTIRLWVSHYFDGVRHAPGEVWLSGSGKDVTILVTGIRGEPGTGPLLAEAFVLIKRSWDNVVASKTSDPVTCAVTV